MKACNFYTAQTGFTIRICRLVVNPLLPWLGASPDAVGIDPSQSSVELSSPNFLYNSKVTLKHNHKHFYQVQGQMALANVIS